MTDSNFSRRRLLICAAALASIAALPAAAEAAGPAVHVLKDPNCGCCTAWADILKAEGFAVTIELADYDALSAYKSANGIPETMASCHTARVEGYLLEGHVPPADIRRLLAERPDAIGLAVPGMPMGSPGMGPETEREAYDVFLIRHGGSSTVFSRYHAA